MTPMREVIVAYRKKSWTEKLADEKDLPRVVVPVRTERCSREGECFDGAAFVQTTY